MPAKVIQSSFSSGVINPRLAARVDIQHYYQGLRQGVNIVPLVQGGFSRRPGLEYVATVSDGRLEPFEFNTEQTYLMCFTDGNIEVFKDDASAANVTAPWLIAEIADIGVTQSADTMVVGHEDHQTRKLVRGADHATWTLSSIAFENIPKFDFNDTTSPTSTTEEHTLTFGGTWAANEWFKLVVRGSVTEQIFWAADADVLKDRIRSAVVKAMIGLLARTGYGSVSVRQVTYTQNGKSVSVTGTYPNLVIEFADGDAADGDELTVAELSTAAGTLVSAASVNGVPRSEDVWSSARGWPKYPIFFEGRLWFGGSKSKPTSLFGSVTNDFFNFELGDGLDDEAIFWPLDTDQVNAITGLQAARRLQVFTTGGEHVVPDSPATPGLPRVPQQTEHGTKAIKPVNVDGATIFIQRKGRQVREFRHEFVEDAYIAKSLSLLAPQLFDDPVDMAALRGTSDDDGAFVYIVNADGTVSVLLTQRDQEIAAWVQWDTDGKFKSVAVVDDTVYFLVEREVAGSTVYYIEKLNKDFYLDAAVQDTLAPGTVLTGLDHLNGKTVRVRADDSVRKDQLVTGGQITLEREGTNVEAGLWFEPKAETMPPNVNLPSGATLTSLKRIVSVDVIVLDTLGVVINGDRLPDRKLDIDKLDTPSTPFTGVREHKPSESRWEISPTVTISQNDPLPMTILGAVYEVELGD